MAATFSVFDTLIQNSDQIINACTIDDDKIFHKETIGRIPPTMKNPWTWV